MGRALEPGNRDAMSVVASAGGADRRISRWRGGAGRGATPYLLLVPGALVVATFLGSLVVAGGISLRDANGALSLVQYKRFFTDPFYLDFLWRSLRIAAYSTPITLLLGYPYAYVMARSAPPARL